MSFNSTTSSLWQRYDTACRLYDSLIKSRDRKKIGDTAFAGITIDVPFDIQSEAARCVAEMMRGDIDAYAARAIEAARADIAHRAGLLIEALKADSELILKSGAKK
jgi:hypothetical protein